MDGDYALKDYYAKIDEIIDYAKKKTKIKYFNSNSDENISNSLNKTLRGIEYDEEKNIFYMDLEKSDRDYDSTYSKKNRTNDEKLYRVYFKLNYVYDGKRTDDVDFNYIINDIKSKNEDEIDDIKLVDDEFYGESGYNYLNVEITDKNGNKYKSKIIIETDQNQNQDYDQSGNINYDKPILTEEEIKNGQISNEHYNEIRNFIKSKDIFKPKNKFYIRNSVLNLDNNYRYYVSLTDGKYSKNFYLKTVENEEKNIDLNNLIVDDEVHYLQDINSIINDPIFGYDTLRVKTIIDNGQKYNLISAENNLLPLSSFIYRKYPNENIVTNDENQKELIVKITDENNNLRTAKIILTPSKISEHYNYSYQNNKQKNLDFLNIDVSFTEKKNELLTDETINRINEKINNKINNNPLYNENFILNDKNIYKYNNYQYMRVYDKNDGKYLYVKISNTKPDFEINLTEDEPDEEDLNFLKSLKISEYNCYIDEISKYYTSKQGNLSVLDFVNSKLNENEYINNFEQKNEYTEKENLNLFIFHIKNKTNNTTRYITINLSTPNIINSVYLDNFNVNLILTDKNKEDLKTIIKRYAKRNYKKIDIDDQLKKDENGQFYANVTIYFDDDVHIKKEIEIAKSDVYYIGLTSPACPPETRSSIIDYPKYPEECQRTFRVIINPSLKTTYNLISCLNKPEKPNEIPKNEKPPVVITPSNFPKESPSELPKENEPKQSTPNKTIPNRNATSKPTEKTPNEVVEKTPITIISNEKKQSVNGESREIENTTGLPNIERTPVKTNDYLFSIISVFGMIGIFIYFMNSIKKKFKLN